MRCLYLDGCRWPGRCTDKCGDGRPKTATYSEDGCIDLPNRSHGYTGDELARLASNLLRMRLIDVEIADKMLATADRLNECQ